MALPRAVEIVTRVVLLERDRILLVRGAGASYHLPGGPVRAAGGAGQVVERERTRTGAGPGHAPTFAGAVEHEHGEGDGHRHELTLLFAVDLPVGERSEPDPQLVPVRIADLATIDLRPVAVADGVRQWLGQRTPVWTGLPARIAPSRFSGPVQSVRAQLIARRAELRSGAFKDASVAICALVAAADGRIDPSERALMVNFITTDEILSHFDANELEREFEDLLDLLARDPEDARALALRQIVKVRRRPAEANAVIQIGIVMGCSDGYFDDTEKVVVREAARALGLDPADFPLDTTETERFEAPADNGVAEAMPEVDELAGMSAFLLYRTGSRVLVATPRGGEWYFLPGGSVRAGESVAATLRRTAGGTTGLSTSGAAFAGATEFTVNRGGERYYDLGLIFVAPVPRGDIASRDPETDVVLLAEGELTSLSFRPPAVARALRDRIETGRPVWRPLPPPT